jgi:hypothetical protein
MSGRDFVRAGIDQPHSHEHEWVENPGVNDPLIEDGAAIFRQECNYSEGRYGEKYQCQETKTYRFEMDRLVFPDGFIYDLPTIENWDEISEEIQKCIIEIEELPKEDVEMNIHPDPDNGEVAISYDGYTLCYEP